jgi:hypothetical protein
MEQTVTKVEMSEKHGTIIHYLADGSQKEWAAIRAGLSWPTESANGYFIVLGEEFTGGGTVYEGEKPRRGKILLLAEQELQSPFLNDTLKPLTDECSLLGCISVFADFEETTERNMEDVLLAREYINEHRLNISFSPAPFQGKFKTGVDIIRFALNDALLDLPAPSLAQQQLDILSQADLTDKPEVKFVAVNGLRLVMGAFHKFAPGGRQYIPNRRKDYTRRTARGASRF